jgi:hypothetical protein
LARPVKLAVFSLITVLLTIVVAEGILNLLSARIPSVNAVLTRTRIQTAIIDSILGWRGNPDHPEHDRLGFRNRDVPRDMAIIALGDSQTYGLGIKREEAWPQQLERLIGQRTYGLAFPGWGPIQSLTLLERELPVQPRLVISALYAGNDLADAYLAVYPRGLHQELRSTDERVLRAIADRDRRPPWENEIVNPVINPNSSRPDPARAAPNFSVENTRLYGLWRAVQRANRRPEQDDEPPRGTDRRPLFDNGRLRTILNPYDRLTLLDLSDPRIAEGLRLTLASIAAQREHARAQGAGFTVLLIPTKELAFQSAVDGSSTAALTKFRTLRTLANRETIFWDTIRAELTSSGIPYIDALPMLRTQIESGIQLYPESWDGHPNPAGQRVLAELIRADLDRTGLLALMPRE